MSIPPSPAPRRRRSGAQSAIPRLPDEPIQLEAGEPTPERRHPDHPFHRLETSPVN